MCEDSAYIKKCEGAGRVLEDRAIALRQGVVNVLAGVLANLCDVWIKAKPKTPVTNSTSDFGEELAGSGTDDLWMMCASQASAGTQAKALYRSYDGGLTWALSSAANAPVLSGNVVMPAAGGLPVGGYVAPYSLGHQNFAVLSPTTAWLFFERGGVFETTDGGSSWAPVTSLAKAGFAGGGAGSVTFIDATQGWVCQTGTGLWHTSDGVNWARLS